MDVLTIILIFLLVNYSEVVENINLDDSITLPTVKVKHVGKAAEGVPFVVGKDSWQVGDNPKIVFSSFEDQRDEVMEKTANILSKVKENNDKNDKKTNIIVLADKETPYSMLDSVLIVAGGVGITAIDFIAQKNDP